jgi:hypothetical protein
MLRFDQPPENICIIRLSALGDVTHAVPVLRAIQKQWPQSRITWITSKLEHKLLSLLDGVRFIVVDKNNWRESASTSCYRCKPRPAPTSPAPALKRRSNWAGTKGGRAIFIVSS